MNIESRLRNNYSDSDLSSSGSDASNDSDGDVRLSSSSEESEEVAELQNCNEFHRNYKKVLVTGAAGFIGYHTSVFLLERGDDVVVVDEVNDYYDITMKRRNLKDLMDTYGPNRVSIYEGDICDRKFIEGVFEAEKPEWIIHLAARAGVRPSIEDPFIYIHSNIEATTRLMELAKIYGNKHFVYASSSSVYGGSDKEVFRETDVVDFPVSPYAASKKSCELMAHTFHHLYGLHTAGLRFFTVYGPRGRPDMAPYKFVDRVSRGVPIQQFGDGSTSRDYTYVDDIVNGVVRSLDRPRGCQVYNLGNGSPIYLRDFISTVQKSVGKEAIIEYLPEQPGDVPRTCADISKARRMLGYEPEVPFEEGIYRTAKWYKERAIEREQEMPTNKVPVNAVDNSIGRTTSVTKF